MNDNVVKTCVSCNTKKHINIFYNKFSEYIACNIEKVLKRYYKNQGEVLQQRRNKCARFKGLDNK